MPAHYNLYLPQVNKPTQRTRRMRGDNTTI